MRVSTRAMRPRRRPSARGGASSTQHLIALHGAAQFIRRDKNIVFTAFCAVGRADEAEAVAMQIEPSGYKIVAGRNRSRNTPLVAIKFDKVSTRRETRQMLQQQTSLASASQAKFPYKLFVASPLTGGALDVADQFTVGHIADAREIAFTFEPYQSILSQKRLGNDVQFSSNRV